MSGLGRHEPTVYAALRIVAGAMFALHALPKLFGIYGATVPTGSQLWIGGVIELVAGTLIALGAFARPAAFVASGTMAVAFFQFHVAKSGELLPIANKGDAAVLYCFLFLLVVVRGAGAWSVDHARGRA